MYPMNFNVPGIPLERTEKPRKKGLTMVMDKNFGLIEAKILVEKSQFIDIIKLGFGTSSLMPKLKEKVRLYQKAGIKVCFGGTLAERFIEAGKFSEYLQIVNEMGLNCIEISDGSISIPHIKKLRYIEKASKKFEVFSEVGHKDPKWTMEDKTWAFYIKEELKAGAEKVITEARESGTVGIYEKNGRIKKGLVSSICLEIDENQIIWEAPKKDQQVWFIKKFGCNVNLGNILPEEVIPLETLRIFLRGDTFDMAK